MSGRGVHKPRYSFITLVLAFIVAVIVLPACSGYGDNDNSDNALSESTPPAKTTALPTVIRRTPLIIRDGFFTINNGEGIVMYPSFVGSSDDNTITTAPIINSAIRNAADELLSLSSHIHNINYTLYYNDNGILSLSLDAYAADEEIPYIATMTFDCDTGERITIDRLFDGENTDWRRVIPDLITRSANSLKMTLLSDLMPIDDNQAYYITDNGVIVLYQLYEITTYEHSTPRFFIEFSRLQEYISDSSILNRLINDG